MAVGSFSPPSVEADELFPLTLIQHTSLCLLQLIKT